jgi:hypothetical protein
MKTRTIAAATIAALLLAVVAAAALASTGNLSATPSVRGQDNGNHGDNGHHEDNGHHGPVAACDNLTLGETLTVSGLTGHYANASDREMHGNATGTLTFKVSGIFATGCTLSITGGSFKLNTTTYTVTGGSIVLNHGGRSGEGSGTTSTGSFLISIDGLHGNSKSASTGAIRLDFESGKSEFLVNLHSPAAQATGDNHGDDR